jgi:acyl-CoA reductase-like NAD-dependent aldehyde dehydrogenase
VKTVEATRMLIGSEWREAVGHATFESHNPATGEVLAELPDARTEDLDAAVQAARDAFAAWSRMDAAKRGRILMAIADRLEAEQELIARLETRDNGRPYRETAAQAAVVAKWYRYFGGLADKIEGATLPVEGPYLNYTRRVPVGVCGAITPWNHPLLIATKKIAPALACGNTVVVKPSELAPLSVLEFGRIALDAGLPPGVLNVVTGGREAGEALVAHPDVARIDLTGSTPTGIAIAKAAAEQLKRVGLELGGRASTIVFADADLARSVPGAVFAGYIAQGQSCVAGARVLVERSIAEEFVERMVALVRAISVGDPQSETTQMGPLITPAAAERVRSYVESSVAEGGEVLAGGRQPASLEAPLVPDAFLEPTLIRARRAGGLAAREEVFGPVVTLAPFEDEDEAIELANETPFGLAAGIWTNRVSRAHRVAEKLRAGVIWINDYHRIDPASPWGGFGLSGYGRENGFEAVELFTEVKSIWVGTEDEPIDWYESSGARRLN